MKKISSAFYRSLLLLSSLLIISSCFGTHQLTVTPSVSLNKGNFKYVRYVSAEENSSYVFGIGGMSSEQRTTNAYNSLMKKADFQHNQAIANISCRTSARRYFPFGIFLTTVTTVVSGWVVEFLPEGPSGVAAGHLTDNKDLVLRSDTLSVNTQKPSDNLGVKSANDKMFSKNGKLSDWTLVSTENQGNHTVVTIDVKLNQKGSFWIPNSVCLEGAFGKVVPVLIRIKKEGNQTWKDIKADEKINGKSGEVFLVNLFFERLPEQVATFKFSIPDFINWEGIPIE